MSKIEFSELETYPKELVDFLEKNKSNYVNNKFNNDELNNELDLILNKYKYICYHFTKIADEKDYSVGIVNNKYVILKIYKKNLKGYYNNRELSIIEKEIMKFDFQNVFFTFDLKAVLSSKSLQGTTTQYYGGENLKNLIGNYFKNKDEILKDIGKPAYIKFWINYNNNYDIKLKIPEIYYKLSSKKECELGESYVNYTIPYNQIENITYI